MNSAVFIMNRQRLCTVLVFAIIVIFFLLFRIDLVKVSDGSEFRAEVAREMMETGSYLVPMLGNERLLTKPPLYYDYVILFYKVAGEASLFAARASSMVASVLILILTYYYAVRYTGLKRPLSLTAILFFTPLYLYCSRRVELEILLTLEILAGFVFLKAGIDKDSALLKSLSYLFITLAFFTKGPIIILFCVFWILFYMLFMRRPFPMGKILSVPGLLTAGAITSFFVINYITIASSYLETGTHEVARRFPLVDYLHNPLLFLYNFALLNPLTFFLYLFPVSLFVLYIPVIRDPRYSVIKIMTLGIIVSIFTFNQVYNYYYLPALPYITILAAKLIEDHYERVRPMMNVLTALILIIINVVLFILSPIYSIVVFAAFLFLSVVGIIYMIKREKTFFAFIMSLALAYLVVINYIEPLDESNERAVFFRTIKNSMPVNNANIPIYNVGGDKISFAFGLKRIILKTSLEKLTEDLQLNKRMMIIADKENEIEHIMNAPNLKIKKSILYYSVLAGEIYPLIPLYKGRAVRLLFVDVEYVP